MTTHDEVDPVTLEREVQQALDALPPPRAPKSLLPRVMTDVRRRAASGGRVPAAVAIPDGPRWLTWTPVAQAALVAVALAIVSAVYWAWPLMGDATAFLPEPLQQGSRHADLLIDTLSDLLQVGALVWHAVVGPIVKALFVLTVVLGTACALCAAALGRIALGGIQQS